MPSLLRETLIRLEEYKFLIPHYKELLDILEEILILREEYSMKMNNGVFTVDDSLIDVKLSGGFPIIDITRNITNYAEPERYFTALLSLTAARSDDDADCLKSTLGDPSLSYPDLMKSVFTGEIGTARFDEKEESDEHFFDLMRFLVEESLRPALELMVEKYDERIKVHGWFEGYCPICGREPKIGKLTDNGMNRFLFCNQCGYEWFYEKDVCPFCGNDDQEELAYFIVEDDERYRVDVCNFCKRYVKTVEFDGTNTAVNMDVEDIATLHLDILANEEGYD